MNECNYGRIPPCYGGKKFRIHEELEKIKAVDETHDMVYELNKQMCDLERGLSNDFLDMQVRIADKLAKDVIEGVRTPDWAKNMLAGIPEQLSRAEYEILEEILKEKNRFMEKKTKKMTKAEAFEYLKGKKVYVNSHSAHIQATLFEAGYTWSSGSCNIDNEDMPFLMTTNHGVFYTLCNMRDFAKDDYEEISADDILSIEIIEENRSEDEVVEIVELGKKIMCLLPKLSGHRHVVITETDVLLYDEGISLYHSDPF